jgi:hypothetical protein
MAVRLRDSKAVPDSTTSADPKLQADVSVAAFVKSLRDLSNDNSIDLAIDSVIDRFDSLLMNGDFETREKILLQSTSQIEYLDPAISAAILSMTFVAKEQLSTARIPFYERLMEFLQRSMPATEAAKVLKGLA